MTMTKVTYEWATSSSNDIDSGYTREVIYVQSGMTTPTIIAMIEGRVAHELSLKSMHRVSAYRIIEQTRIEIAEVEKHG